MMLCEMYCVRFGSVCQHFVSQLMYKIIVDLFEYFYLNVVIQLINVTARKAHYHNNKIHDKLSLLHAIKRRPASRLPNVAKTIETQKACSVSSYN